MSLEEHHWGTITPVMRQVLLTFSATRIGEHFYLAGEQRSLYNWGTGNRLI